MSKKPKPKPSPQGFAEVARKIGCDEDEAAFDEKLRRIGTAKPSNSGKKRTQSKIKPGN